MAARTIEREEREERTENDQPDQAIQLARVTTVDRAVEKVLNIIRDGSAFSVHIRKFGKDNKREEAIQVMHPTMKRAFEGKEAKNVALAVLNALKLNDELKAKAEDQGIDLDAWEEQINAPKD